ncbi:hypothetical protein [Rhizobium mesoamericanum]|uniref:hypothetical protein n=1 Tax=Rhizobium mesoamericanum TaxID=1079800 RepID=UPI0027D8B51C|nr:hypothetical protein [Rhizobium mesoamericanum]
MALETSGVQDQSAFGKLGWRLPILVGGHEQLGYVPVILNWRFIMCACFHVAPIA